MRIRTIIRILAMGCILAGVALVTMWGRGSIFAAGALALIGIGIGILGLTAMVTGEMGRGWRLLRRADHNVMDRRALFGAEARLEGLLMALAAGALIAAAYVEQFLPGGLQGNLSPGNLRGTIAVVAGLMFAAMGVHAVTPPRKPGAMAIILMLPRIVVGLLMIIGGLGVTGIGTLAVLNQELPVVLDPTVRQFFEAR